MIFPKLDRSNIILYLILGIAFLYFTFKKDEIVTTPEEQLHLAALSYLKKDYVKAFAWCSEAANGNLVAAQHLLATMYIGEIGTKQNYKKAKTLLEKAAKQNFDQAQYTIGRLYEEGIVFPQDNTKAIEWYKKAAMQGNKDAKKKLGILLEKNT